MIHSNIQTPSSIQPQVGKPLSYNEIVAYLDGQWQQKFVDTSKAALKKLDAALGNPSKKLKVIAVAGTNGKSLTINFVTQLLKEEGIKVGAFYSPHFVTYNERFAINNESIANKNFESVANEVIAAAVSQKLELHAQDLLTAIALQYFVATGCEVGVLEVTTKTAHDAVVALTQPCISAITRINEEGAHVTQESSLENLAQYKELFTRNCTIISADQSKLNLQMMEQLSEEAGAEWAMPIRKLAALSYPFEQLHGRCAALAERIAQVFVEKHTNIKSSIVSDSLLAKQKGTRGRPTLEAKRHAELNPKRTVEQFWKETVSTLPGRFELIDSKNPFILLDNASNLDAFKNLLLGIRLLHYARPLKGLTIIVGCENNELQTTEFLKLIRYFFKKTSGQIIFCPIKKDVMCATSADKVWDVEQITNDVKNVKVKARTAKNLADALDQAKKIVDEQNGLIVVTGSRSIVGEYASLNNNSAV